MICESFLLTHLFCTHFLRTTTFKQPHASSAQPPLYNLNLLNFFETELERDQQELLDVDRIRQIKAASSGKIETL